MPIPSFTRPQYFVIFLVLKRNCGPFSQHTMTCRSKGGTGVAGTSVPVSHDDSVTGIYGTKDPETDAACAFPSVTCQNVFCEIAF